MGIVVTMSFDISTQNITLTQKAKFWTNYISALKGQDALCAAGEGESKLWYPSFWESLPPEARDLKKEIGKIEDQMLSRKRAATPLTPLSLRLTTRFSTEDSPTTQST